MKKLIAAVLLLCLTASSAYAACVLKGSSPALYVCLSGDSNPVAGEGARRYDSDTDRVYAYLGGSWGQITTTDLDYLKKADAERLSTGLISGGTLSAHTQPSNQFDISASAGYINDSSGAIGKRITCGAINNVATVGDGTNYVALDDSCNVNVSLTKQSDATYLYLGHVYAGGGNTYIVGTFSVPEWSSGFTGRVNEFVARGIGTLLPNEGGNLVTEGTTSLSLNVSSGDMLSRLGVYSLPTVTTFGKMYNSSDAGWYGDHTNPNLVNTSQWNNPLNPQVSALVTMTDGYWKKDLVLRLANGFVFYIFGQSEYSNEGDAKAAPLPVIPTAVSTDVAYLATIVSQKGDTSLAGRLYDVRPMWSRILGTSPEISYGGYVTISDFNTHETSTTSIHGFDASGNAPAQTHDNARHSTAYAPATEGVTNGNSHDHNGGDGGQVAYTSLSALPTLPSNESGAANNFLTAYNSTTGAFSKAQPSFGNISGTLALSQLTDDATSGLCLKSGGGGGDPAYGSCSAGGGYDTIQDEGGALTQRTVLNFTGTGVACADDTTRTTCTINTGGTDLSAEPFVTSAASANLSAERVFNNGTNTTVDTGTAGQIKINLSGTHADSFHADSYSGIGGCTNQFARTLNDTAAPTCAGVGVNDFTANQGTTTQVLHGNAAGQPSWAAISTADLPTITVAKGGSGLTTVAADQVYVGTAADTFTAKSIPDCDVAGTSKLLYDTTTHAFSCGTDQTSGGGPISAKLTADYTNSTVTGTEVTGLQVTLGAGTYRFSYYLLAQAATIANAFDFGINFTGTHTVLTAKLSYPDTGTSATSGTIDDVITGDGGELIDAQCVNTAESTTTPNLNCITATTTANVNNLVIIEGIIVVTVSGDFELWAASESTTAIRVMTGSNLLVTSF